MPITFFAGGVTVSTAKGNRILAAWGHKFNDDDSPATVAQVEDHLKRLVQTVTDATEQRVLGDTARSGHSSVGIVQ